MMRDSMMTALTGLESEMRAIGWWQEARPSEAALASRQPFCVDTMTFSEWLQWVYVPKMRALLLTAAPLPTHSGLLPMAQEAWRGCDDDATALLQRVALLDQLINDGA